MIKVKLRDAFDLQMGKTPSRSVSAFWNGNHKWVSIGDIGNADKYIFSTKECISEEGVIASGIKMVPENTVIMSFKLSIGKVAITSEDIYTNEAIMAFIDRKKYPVNVDYLYHLLSSIDWTEGTNKAVMGLTLNKATLSEKEIRLPSIDEQLRVAFVLNKIDKLISLRKKQLTKLDELAKARFVEMFGDPASNSKNWPMVSLGELAEIRIGPFGTLLHSEDYIQNGHPLVNPSHIFDGKIITDPMLTVSDEKYAELSAYVLQQNDIVLGRRGEMGRCAVVSQRGLLCGTGSMIIRPSGRMLSYFLQNILSSPSYKKIIEDKAVGVTMKNLNVPIVSSLMIPLLPLELQEQYIRLQNKVDAAKLTILQGLDKLETLKKALMQKYFA